jgi:hypothetical protein
MESIPCSYDDALEIFERRRRNSTLSRGVKLANNTYMTWEDTSEDPKWFGVRFHHTTIVEFYSDGTIALNTGGWETVSTKSRMNDCLTQYGIHQEKFVWYVTEYGRSERVLPIPTECLGMRKKARGRREFENGMTLHPEGLWHDEEMKYSE